MLKRFISYYKPYKRLFFFDLFCAFMISFIDVLYPWILNRCVSTLYVQSSKQIMSILLPFGVGLLALYIIRSLCRYFVAAQGHIMGAYMEGNMRQDLFEQYERLSFSYYDTHNTGVMMSKVVSDLFDISEFAHHGPENLFISVIKIVGSFIIMFYIYWPLAILLLFVTLLMLLFSFRQNKRMRATFAMNRKRIGEINASLQDSLAGIRVVQSFGNEDIEKEKFKTSNDGFLESKKDNYYAMGTFTGGNNFFQGLLYIVELIAGGYFIAKGNMNVVTLATFALYINVFVNPIEVLVEFTEMFQKGFSGFRRFCEVMDEIPDIQDKEEAIVLDSVHGDIEFKNVSFQYDEEQSILDHLNLFIPAGKKVALIGPSGAGKTTLCSLIPRFYDVSSGKISIDGNDVRNIQLHSLRSHIGMVQQDVYLFNGTILENILYGRPDATFDEVVEASKQANIHDFIMSLPQGYQTNVHERGTRLSGGQKQRISIARVFLKDPKILILDEATSALDNESERVIQESLDKLIKNRTCVTIAHRLSTIRHADEILVLNENGIAERGTHDELLERNGLYSYYYHMQY